MYICSKHVVSDALVLHTNMQALTYCFFFFLQNEKSTLDVILIAIHMLLSLSALQFHVPVQTNLTGFLWKEVVLHNIVVKKKKKEERGRHLWEGETTFDFQICFPIKKKFQLQFHGI